MRVENVNTVSTVASKRNFKAIKSINPTAYRIAKREIFDASGEMLKLSSDINLEIIGKKGLISKVKSLVFFVTNFGEKKGQHFSLSIDPKGYMPIGTLNKTVKSFTKENIIEAAKEAKALLQNKGAEKLKPVLPADVILLKKFNH